MRLSKYALLLVGCLAAPAFAQIEGERPSPPDRPPGDVRGAQRQEAQRQDAQQRQEGQQRFGGGGGGSFGGAGQFRFGMRRGPTQKGAYLGISTSPAAPVLRKQLGLPDGMGLVVEFIAPESPAATAGVRQYDVLQKLNDQMLINAEQLAVLVRSFKPGEEVKLTVVRDGKSQTVTAKLTEHELEPLDAFMFGGGGGGMQGMPLPDMRAMRPGQGPNRPSPRIDASTLTWIDGDRSYMVIMRDGHQMITVKDRNDRTIFEGPIERKEQRDQLPTDIKDKVEGMLKSGMLPQPSVQPDRGPDDVRKPGDLPPGPHSEE